MLEYQLIGFLYHKSCDSVKKSLVRIINSEGIDIEEITSQNDCWFRNEPIIEMFNEQHFFTPSTLNLLLYLTKSATTMTKHRHALPIKIYQ